MKKKNYIFPTVISIILMFGLLSFSYAGSKDHTAAIQIDSPQTLYQRLGGVYHIAPVVSDFIDRVLKNPVLNANPHINAARKRISKEGLIYRVTSLMCHATGGPEKYTGRTMLSAHQYLYITEREWQAMLRDFKQSLDKYNVLLRDQKALFHIVGKTKSQIIQK